MITNFLNNMSFLNRLPVLLTVFQMLKNLVYYLGKNRLVLIDMVENIGFYAEEFLCKQHYYMFI